MHIIVGTKQKANINIDVYNKIYTNYYSLFVLTRRPGEMCRNGNWEGYKKVNIYEDYITVGTKQKANKNIDLSNIIYTNYYSLLVLTRRPGEMCRNGNWGGLKNEY